MNNLKEIRKQISSINNTKKTTRAMKLVSTSKLKKAEEMAKRATEFSNRLNDVFSDIMNKIKHSGIENIDSKFFSKISYKDSSIVDIIFITADKGLCGGFNSATIKEVIKLKNSYEKNGKSVRLRAVGKKATAYFTFNKIALIDSISNLSSSPNYEDSSNFINKVVEDYLDGKTHEVVIIHNGFKNLITQELRTKQILPLITNPHVIENIDTYKDVLNIEPEDEENIILDELAKKYVEYNMYYSLLDSLAAEHGARMQAMDAATNNATKLVRDLTISYSKARQEAITTELIEINASAEAMK